MGILDTMFGLASAMSGGFGNAEEDDDPIKNILGMGDVNQGLRSIGMGPLYNMAAGNGALGGVKAVAQNPLGGVGLMNQLLGGGGQQPQNLPPGTISEAGATQSGRNFEAGQQTPMYGSGEAPDVQVTGDGWQPRKPTILGAIADAYLEANGMGPAFQQNRDARNVNEAMGDYVNDPMGALKRLSMIRGHEDDVARLKNQYDDNARADRVEERQFGTAQEKAWKHVANMMGAIRGSKDPSASYNANLAFMRNYMESKGLDASLLPDTYDEDKINFAMTQGVDADEQLKMAALEQHRAFQRQLGQGKLNETVRYHDARLEDFDNQEAGRNARDNPPSVKQRLGGRAYKDSNGMLVEFNGEGNKMKVTSKDGKMIYLFKLGVDGKKVPVGQMTKEQYDAEVAKRKEK